VPFVKHNADPQPGIGFHMTLIGRLRAYIFAGILVTAPLAITAYIAWLVVSFIDQMVSRLLPPLYNPNTYLPFTVPGLGVIIVIWALATVGWLAAGLLGRLFLRVSEAVVGRMPVIRSVYGAVKQIFETLFAARSTAFRQVVLVEFPRKGIWRYAFVTGATPGKTQTVTPEGLINVFIPNTPNVTAGFLALLPPSEIIEVDLTVEEALKLMVSGGIAIPSREAANHGAANLAIAPAPQPERSSRAAASRSNT
jgi:uncharacterized membrane protein